MRNRDRSRAAAGRAIFAAAHPSTENQACSV